MTSDLLISDAIGRFSDEARQAVYEAIALRRDIRQFRPERDVDDAVLERILGAAHLAPSVGFSQPWGFVVIRDRGVRERIRANFLRCREAEAVRFPPARREEYLSYKLEGILEAPVNLCVAVDLRDQAGAILGTTVQPEAVRASACCAVQNLWLAARAEGVGVGWVSIVEPQVLRAELALPAGIEPIGYLCIGYPMAFRARPMLEELGWEARRPLAGAIHRERWTEATTEATTETPTAPVVRPAWAPGGAIAAFDEAARDAARAHQARLAKPHGSLGRLEALAAWYAGARSEFPVELPARAALALFAADHGVVAEGVSAYGSQTTAAMVANVMAGGAAVHVLARRAGVEIQLVDVGVAGDLSSVPRDPVVPLVRRCVRAGTANLRHEPAMARRDAEAALQVGAETARAAIARGAQILGLGEIGIGNTTSAAALVCAFTGAAADEIVGRGTGIDDATLARKRDVIGEALVRHAALLGDPVGRLAALGGLELCAMAGCALEAARQRVPVVLDGFLAGAAAIAADAIDRGVRPYLLASHQSAEHGARRVLAQLGLEPVFDLGLRLGEGTGAVLAIDLVRTAVDVQRSMATFATAGIVGRAGL